VGQVLNAKVVHWSSFEC